MARRAEAHHLLAKTDAVDIEGKKINPEQLKNEANHMILRARAIFTPRSFTTKFSLGKTDERWLAAERARIADELGAWRTTLEANILLAQAIYTELWEMHMVDELGKGIDPKAVFKARRFKETTRHPENPPQGKTNLKESWDAEQAYDYLFMRIARHAIGKNIPSDKSDDHDAMGRELFGNAVEAVKKWEGAAAATMYVRLYETLAKEHFPEIS